MYRIIVNGSRGFNNYELLVSTMIQYFSENQVRVDQVEIISGGARGADSLAEKFSKDYGILFHRIDAQWNTYGKKAGLIRNRWMLDYATLNKVDKAVLISFWDGTSTGTKHMIDICIDAKIVVKVIKYNER